jgi:transcriptional regulator with XRE-family HTH domain
MSPQEMIKTLMLVGWNQEGIARYAGVTQPTINRISNGIAKNPRYALVDSLKVLVKNPTPVNRLSDVSQATEDQIQPLSIGMTLRDYFAAKALMGMMASRNPNSPRFQPEDDAAYVYAVADAMLKARGKE